MNGNSINQELLNEAEAFAKKFYEEKMPKGLFYHSLEHTYQVVEGAKLIGGHSDITEGELNEVILAAWFHDLGYYNGPKDHEKESNALLVEFLQDRNIDPASIERMKNCILATQMPPSPKTLQEKVLADSDLLHIGSELYEEKAEQIKKEFSKIMERELSEEEWYEKNIEFFQNHSFYTKYAEENFSEGKMRNLKKVKKALKKIKKMEEPKKQEAIEAQKKIKPDRGRETMFRITSRNHLELSNMADNKANIMISVNSIMLSLIVSMLIRKLEGDPYLIFPTLILVSVCLLTIIFAIRATRPNISSGKFTKEDIRQKKTNLLFFGNFHRVSLDDFEWGMQEMIKDSEYLYSSMIKDIYFLGVILGKKYRNLRIAYTIFMYGFVVAIISYIIAFVNYGVL